MGERPVRAGLLTAQKGNGMAVKEYVLVVAKGSTMQVALQKWAVTLVSVDGEGFPSVGELREFADLSVAKLWALSQFDDVYRYGDYTLPFELSYMWLSGHAFDAPGFASRLTRITG